MSVAILIRSIDSLSEDVNELRRLYRLYEIGQELRRLDVMIRQVRLEISLLTL